MKFRVYGWTEFYRPKDGVTHVQHYGEGEKYWTLGVGLTPHISFSISRHDFLPDEDCPIRRNGASVFILFSWLLWGVTLDFRFGRDTGYWPGHEEK